MGKINRMYLLFPLCRSCRIFRRRKEAPRRAYRTILAATGFSLFTWDRAPEAARPGCNDLAGRDTSAEGTAADSERRPFAGIFSWRRKSRGF
jgi:hypothetical protein